MEEEYKKKLRNKNVPIGGYQPKDILEIKKYISTNHPNFWLGLRPGVYRSLLNRLRHAWNVLTYKADALYWTD